jgi:colanic acid/amylovoran biosynthesis glycosyltransferase
MKLIYITSMFPFGPMEAFLSPETSQLLREGHSLRIVPMNPGTHVVHRDSDEIVSAAVRESILSVRVMVGAFLEALRSPARATRAALLLARSRSLNTFVKNALVFPKGLWTSRVARQFGADHIHAHWASASGTMGLIASTVSGIPWSFTAHRWDISENNLIATKAASAAFVRAISRRGSRELLGYVGSAGAKVKVIHMGVPLPRAVSEQSRRSVLRVIVAANLREVKGHRYLTDAIALARDRGVRIEAEFAGEGPLRAALERQVLDAGLGSAVKFLGVVAHGELLRGMENGRWDVAVLPSVIVSDAEQEGIPVFLIEAMACGLPVIGTRTGGIPELLEGAGVLVPERDPQSIAEAFSRLASEPLLRRELSFAGRRRVEEQFSISTVVKSLVAEMNGDEARAQPA